MAKTKDRVEDVKPYVRRALQDEELRDNVVAAFHAARAVYNDLVADRGVTGLAARVATDDDIQKNLKKTIEELRQASDRIQGKKDHGARNTLLLLTGITLGILFNPVTGADTRKWLKEQILGSDDDFTYQSPSGDNSAS